MIDTTCALMFAVPILLLLLALAFVPVFISKENRKLMDYFMKYVDLQREKYESERKMEKEKAVLNATLQAFERMMLFLERINPANLVTRVMAPGLKAGMLQALIHNNIREEYEHNMSQQLYIPDQTWELIKTAKEEVVSMVNKTASKVKQDADGSEFAKQMLMQGYSGKTDPVQKAILSLKKDLKDTL